MEHSGLAIANGQVMSSNSMSHSVSELTSEQIKQIATETIGQSTNLNWHNLRKNLLTASQFGKAIRAYEYNIYIFIILMYILFK